MPLPTIRAGTSPCPGPALIAAGLTLLIAAAWWPAAPVVTAMGLVTLGATNALIARFRGASGFVTLLAAHLFVYGSLYLLLVGAVRHGATAGPERGWHVWQWLDLAASVWPMGLAAKWALLAMRTANPGGGDAPAR